MNEQMLHVLKQEQSIFIDYNESITIQNFRLFYAPSIKDSQYYNMAYPLTCKEEPDNKELKYIKEFYRNKGLEGLIASTNNSYLRDCKYSYHYMKLEKKITKIEDVQIKITCKKYMNDNELDAFCNIMKNAFSFSDELTEYFHDRLQILSKNHESNHWLVFDRDSLIACSSTFRTNDGGDFLFNVAVTPEYRKKSIGLQLIKYISQYSNSPLYVFTPNSIMKNRILPSIGFSSIGDLLVVPLSHLSEK
ncbi:MAG: GNAT family N-acetyltransferase [Pseudomonadota bacterium]